MAKQEIIGIQNIKGFLKDLAVALPSGVNKQHRLHLSEGDIVVDVFLAGDDLRTIPLKSIDFRLPNDAIIDDIIELINIELHKEYRLNDEATKD